MAVTEPSASGFRARAGTLTLMYVASSVSRRYLRQILLEGLMGGEHYEGDDELELAREEGRGELRRLVEVDGDELRVTGEGKGLHYVNTVLDDWLSRSPQGRLRLAHPEARRALGALVFGWSATVIHALAPAPLTLLELKRAVDSVSTEVVIERVADLEASGLVETEIGADGKKRYAVTRWLREGVAPLAAAGRLERHFPPADTVPPDSLDVGAAFFLAVPLIALPAELAGTCRMEVGVEPGGQGEAVGVTVRVDGGRVVSCAPGLDPGADAFAEGSALAWFDTLVEPEVSEVRTGGEEVLAAALLDTLHETLFGAVAAESP